MASVRARLAYAAAIVTVACCAITLALTSGQFGLPLGGAPLHAPLPAHRWCATEGRSERLGSDAALAAAVTWDSGDVRRQLQRRRMNAVEVEFGDRMARVQAERRLQLADGCRRLLSSGTGSRAARWLSFMRTFNVPALRLTYCAIPKCGTTTWFSFCEKATGNACRRNGTTVHDCARVKFERPSSVLDFQPSSLVVLRDPWRRLVSAYEDKFVWERHPLAASCYRRRGKSLDNGEPVTFAEFVRCILEEHRAGCALNAHYAPQHWQCSLCQVPYSYIAKLETLSDDFHYLATFVFPENYRNYRKYSAIFSSSPRRTIELRNVTSIAYDDCYRSLDSEDAAELIRLYRPDAELLGYPLQPLP